MIDLTHSSLELDLGCLHPLAVVNNAVCFQRVNFTVCGSIPIKQLTKVDCFSNCVHSDCFLADSQHAPSDYSIV